MADSLIREGLNEQKSDRASVVMQQALQLLRSDALFENIVKSDHTLKKHFPAFPDQLEHDTKSVDSPNTTRNPYADGKPSINRIPEGDRNFCMPREHVDAPLLVMGDPPGRKRELRIVPELQGPPETVQNMASRLLLSAGAGYAARQALFMSGLHRTPVVGPALCLSLPLTAAGLTSVYLKHDNLNVLENKKSFAEGVVAYGVCFRGFDKAIGDTVGGLTERSMLRAELMTGTSFIRRPLALLRP